MLIGTEIPRTVLVNPHGLALETRTPWQIPNETKPEKPIEALEAARDLYAERHPEAQLRRLSAVYNCIGLVVANRRTSVDPSYFDRIMVEDGFRSFVKEGDLAAADVVVYEADRQVAHVAIVTRIEPNVREARRDVWVLSKWGYLGEYIHKMNDVPEEYGPPTRFYTNRS